MKFSQNPTLYVIPFLNTTSKTGGKMGVEYVKQYAHWYTSYFLTFTFPQFTSIPIK